MLCFVEGTVDNSDLEENDEVSAPTHQMVLAWFREKGIFLKVEPLIIDNKVKAYKPFVTTLKNNGEWKDVLGSMIYTGMYEEAIEEGLNYILKNLL